MDRNWLDERGSLLTDRCPLPLDEPFTGRQAHQLGVSRRCLRELKQRGLVRQVIHEVYAVAQAPNDMRMRASGLALVIPDEAVVADRTAAWLHGVDLLPRSALSTPVPVQVVHMDDTRVRRPEADGRRRGLLPTDITTVGGIRATTAVRTSLDLGRMLWRYDALAAIDGFLRIGVPHDLMAAEMGRFRGYRGIVQLRRLLPLGDARAESPGESALRLHWYEADLGRPELQWWVYDDGGVPIYRLDIADPVALYAAEYNGEEFHTSPSDVEYDERRADWLQKQRHWNIDVFTKAHVYGNGGVHDPLPILQGGHAEALRTRSLWTPHRRAR